MMSRRPYWCSKQILWELDSSYVKNFSCSHKFAWMLATWENTLYTKNVKFERDLWTTNEEYRYAKSPNCVRGTRTQPLICFWCTVHYWVTCAINKGVTEINTLDQIIGKVMDMSRTHVPLNVLIGLVRNLNSDVKAFKPVNSMWFILSTSWWLDGVKNNRENYPKKCFWRKKKNLGLRTNRPLRNCAQWLAPVEQNVPFTRPTLANVSSD